MTRAHDTPAGDFVRDARRDHQMPTVIAWSELETYLRVTRGADDQVIRAARQVWHRFTRAARVQAPAVKILTVGDDSWGVDPALVADALADGLRLTPAQARWACAFLDRIQAAVLAAAPRP
jgi:hypothetical protein